MRIDGAAHIQYAPVANNQIAVRLLEKQIEALRKLAEPDKGNNFEGVG